MKKDERALKTDEQNLAAINKFIIASGGALQASARLGVSGRTLNRWRYHEVAVPALAMVAINALLKMDGGGDGMES